MPSPPGDEDEDFILVHHSDVQISEKAEQVYTQLAKILKEQYEVKLHEKNWKMLMITEYHHVVSMVYDPDEKNPLFFLS